MTSTAPTHRTRQGKPAAAHDPSWLPRLRGAGRNGPDGTAADDVRDRLVPPFAVMGPGVLLALGLPRADAARLSRIFAWAGPLLVTLAAGLMRFWNLGKPEDVIFDETYYAKDSWAIIHRGYELNWPKNINDEVLEQGSRIALPADPAYVVHPPVGKYVIGLGEWLFGFTPFGWRFMTAVLGTLSVLMVCRIGRRLFRSTFLGCLAGALLAVDGLHFVMSRTALLDQVLMFFVLAAFGCLVLDRDRARARIAAALPVDEGGSGGEDDERGAAGAATGRARPDPDVAETFRHGLRPWRIAAGVCLGLAFGTKWNGLYILAAFGLMTVWWDVATRRAAGAGRPYLAVFKYDLGWAFLSTVPVAVATYLASWTGWILSPDDGSGGYFRDWAATDGKGGHFTWLPDWMRSLWHYEHEVYTFHVNLDSPHTYQSNPWSWLVAGRPVSFFYESPAPGTNGCPPDTKHKCAQEVLALGTPLLWWTACFALLYVLYRWAFCRDWRAGAIAGAVVAGHLPWFFYQDRTIFSFYAVVFVPFLCLAVAMMIGALLGPPGASERRRIAGAVGAGTLVLLIFWNFIYFWPIYTGQPIPIGSWRGRMWLDTWV